MTDLPIVRSVAELRLAVRGWRAAGLRVALVPTMGFLHAGHLSLVTLGKARADKVVASLFVNPTQFAPSEDFEAYPRNEARDAELLASAHCDLLYAPTVAQMYPNGFSTTVSVAGVSAPMDGLARPTHFAGVATVVAKLITQAEPDVAIFGEKDFQQLLVIERMARDLDLPAQILGAPIVREPDGLAMSSRNVYLTSDERGRAPRLNEALRAASEELRASVAIAEVEARGVETLADAGFGPIDYFEVRGARDLYRLGPGALASGTPARIFAAARMGKARLIDNIAV
ncbi:MAG TPA: pantoate--beta-alanine ligase [Caulobacteraceae bacterium]|jgi:pantoate--beta-alanine ligase|nr:pantoate--beta-alanine ligase [Caulobacteraceae bacterium]